MIHHCCTKLFAPELSVPLQNICVSKEWAPTISLALWQLSEQQVVCRLVVVAMEVTGELKPPLADGGRDIREVTIEDLVGGVRPP